MWDLDETQKEIGKWANATFPFQTDQSVVKHLVEEVAELAFANGVTYNDMDLIIQSVRLRPVPMPEESKDGVADCGILLACLADRQGFSMGEEMGAKMGRNKHRVWSLKTNAMGYHRHLLDEDGNEVLIT